MDDPGLVRGGERGGDLRRNVECGGRREPVAIQPLTKCLAVNELGDDVMRSIRLADLENREDVRMVERGGGASLLLEAAHASGVPAELGGEQLERDLATELRIFSQVDFAHPARAEFGE